MYDLDQTIELLQRAVTEKGDGHRADCQYQRYEGDGKTGEPVCIVGHVLSYLGLLDEVCEGDQIDYDWQPVRDKFTPAALMALADAQFVQDNHQTWGEALIAAKEVRP